MTQNNTLYEFIRLTDANELPYPFTLKHNFKDVEVFEYLLEPVSKTYYLFATPFEIDKHTIEVYATPFYNASFSAVQFGYFKYDLLLKNSESDKTHHVEMFVTEQGFIEDLYIYASVEGELNEQILLPRSQIDEVIATSNGIIQPFYDKMLQAKKQRIQMLEAEFHHCVQELYGIWFESKDGDMEYLVKTFIETLYRLSLLNPKDYDLLFQNFSNIFRRANIRSISMEAVHEHEIQLLPSIAEIQDILRQNIPKSRRSEDDKIIFCTGYLEQVIHVAELANSSLEMVFSLNVEISAVEQFAQFIGYCSIQRDIQKFFLDFLSAQVIVKDYSFFETTFEFCGNQVPPKMLEALAKQGRTSEFKKLLACCQLTYKEIHSLMEKLISNFECVMILNKLYPINFLQLDAQGRPLGCMVLNLPIESLSRQHIINEHRQFTTVAFYQSILNTLYELPFSLVKDDIVFVAEVLKRFQPPSSSSVSMFQPSLNDNQELQEKIIVHRLHQEELKNKISRGPLSDISIKATLLRMIKTLMNQFHKFVILGQPQLTISVFDKFTESLQQLSELLDIQHQIQKKKSFSSHNSKRQALSLQKDFEELMKQFYNNNAIINRETLPYLKDVNHQVLTDLSFLINWVEELQKEPSPSLIANIQEKYQQISAAAGALSLKEREIIEKLFYMPLDAIMRTVACEIRAYQDQSSAGVRLSI